MSKSSSIPRFLLPQLTWKSSLPRTFALVPQARPPPPTWSTHPNGPLHRPITSIAQPWYNFGTRPSRSQKTTPRRPRARHSSVTAREPNPLRAAYRIISQAPFSTTAYLFRDHHFDTLKFVQRLKDEGFSEEQSKAMMLVLSDVIEESIQNLTRTMVLREGGSSGFPIQLLAAMLIASL